MQSCHRFPSRFLDAFEQKFCGKIDDASELLLVQEPLELENNKRTKLNACKLCSRVDKRV